jgi:hypothetical protein
MAAAAVYVVTTTLGPQYEVSQAEYEQLLEQNLVDSLDGVFVPPDDVVVSLTPPVDPPVGQVWANQLFTTIP